MVGCVAIGRNEGERLAACLRSLLRSTRPRAIVYVDSGSTDGSVALARGLGVQVVELDLSIPFTAARARNVGYEHLARTVPTDRAPVQFVDGGLRGRPGVGSTSRPRAAGRTARAGRRVRAPARTRSRGLHLQPPLRHRVGHARGRRAQVRRRRDDPPSRAPGRRRLRPVAHRGRGARAVRAPAQEPLRHRAPRRRDDAARRRTRRGLANGGSDRCARATPAPRASRCTARRPSGTTSSDTSARSSGRSVSRRSPSGPPCRRWARAWPCWAATCCLPAAARLPPRAPEGTLAPRRPRRGDVHGRAREISRAAGHRQVPLDAAAAGTPRGRIIEYKGPA